MHNHSALNILVIDDDLLFTESIEDYLTDNEYSVSTAENGTQGLAALEQSLPDVVLVDLNMPDMSGLQVLEVITSRYPEVPTIMISGTGIIQDALEAMKKGAWDFITKPIIDFNVLDHAIGKVQDRVLLLQKNREYQAHLEITTAELQKTNEKLLIEITDREKAENKIRQREMDYQLLMENSGSAVGYLDKDGRFLLINSLMRKIIGLNREQIVGQHLSSVLPTTMAEKYHRRFLDVLQNEQSTEFEDLEETAMGPQWLQINVQLVRDIDDNIKGIQVIATDISRRKRLETQLLETNNKLEEKVQLRTMELHQAMVAAESANRAKSEFLANMSHELRTPLHGILNFANLGIDRIDRMDRAKHLDFLQEIHGSGERLLNLVNNLLDLSRLESGKMSYTFEYQPLSSVVKAVVTRLAPSCEQKQISLDFEMPGFDDRAVFDDQRISQVVENLISNALTYSPAASRVQIKMREDDKNLTLSIADQGVGIPESEISDIFDTFTQSSQTDNGAGGTGLGLPISHQTIMDHKGLIWAENNVDSGATFSFTLPKQYQVKKKLGEILLDENVISEGTLYRMLKKQEGH